MQRIEEMANGKGCTASQLALAWVLNQGQDIVPIPGTKRRKYLEENISAMELRLSKADLAQIEEVAPKGAVLGPRYPEHIMQLVGR